MEDRNIKFRIAETGDAPAISALFIGHINNNTEYLSHGEMQMGVAASPGQVAQDASQKWLDYITGRINDRDSNVLVVTADGTIAGFTVVQLAEDGNGAFGVMNDILVHDELRGRGIGKTLLEKGLEWFQGRGVGDCYLESGRHNHFAHEFFERQGFRLTSLTFHMNINRRSELEFPDHTAQ